MKIRSFGKAAASALCSMLAPLSGKAYLTGALCSILFTFCLLVSPSWAATYYVDATNGSDFNTGISEAASWKTIAKVNSSNFQPGDVILFKRGEIWRDSLIIPSSGTSDKYITCAAYGTGERPVIDGEYERDYCVNFENRDYVILSDMHVKRAKRTNIEIWNGGTYNIIENVESEYAQGHGIELTDPGCHHNTVQNCETHHNGTGNFGCGVIITESSHSNTVENVVSHHNAEDGVAVGGDEFAGEQHVGGPNNIIKGCELYSNYEDGIDMKQGPQIIEHNICRDNKENGINAWDYAEYVTIRYNIVINNNYTGLRLGGTSISQSSSNDEHQVYNNIISKNGKQAILAGSTLPIHDMDTCEIFNNVFYHNSGDYGDIRYVGANLRFKNNIIVSNDAPYCLRVDNYTSPDTIQIDHNLYDNNTPNHLGKVLRDADNGVTFEEQQIDDGTAYSLTGWEKHGITGVPQFVDPPNYDFGLKDISPCRDAGTDVGLTRDHIGTPVPQGMRVDIGAYEYHTAVPAPPTNLRLIKID